MMIEFKSLVLIDFDFLYFEFENRQCYSILAKDNNNVFYYGYMSFPMDYLESANFIYELYEKLNQYIGRRISLSFSKSGNPIETIVIGSVEAWLEQMAERLEININDIMNLGNISVLNA